MLAESCDCWQFEYQQTSFFENWHAQSFHTSVRKIALSFTFPKAAGWESIQAREGRECCHIFTQHPSPIPRCVCFETRWSCDQLLSSQIHHLLVLELAAFPILTLMGLLGKWLDIVWAQLLMVDGVFCLETHSDVLRTCVEELWECSAERQSVNT